MSEPLRIKPLDDTEIHTAVDCWGFHKDVALTYIRAFNENKVRSLKLPESLLGWIEYVDAHYNRTGIAPSKLPMQIPESPWLKPLDTGMLGLLESALAIAFNNQDRRTAFQLLRQLTTMGIDLVPRVQSNVKIVADTMSVIEKSPVVEALEFYANPYGRKGANGKTIEVPDYYEELEFGTKATEALDFLSKIKKGD